jgi:cyclic-di-AMP phosphodiesterase PgpH
LKIFLNALLVVVSVFSCYVEEIYLHFRPLRPDTVVYLTLRSQLAFNFDQEKALGSKRNLAISQFIPLYSYVPDRTAASKKMMQDLISKVSSLQPKEQIDGDSFTKYLRKENGVEVSQETALLLLQYPSLKNLLEAVLTIEESMLQSKIIEDPQHLKGKKTAEVLYPDPIGTIAYPATEFITLDEARRSLQTKVSQVFWQVDRSLLDSVLQISLASLLPNLKYDQKENDRRIEEIIRRYPSKIVPYRIGEVLVPFRKLLTEEDVLLLAAHQEAAKQRGVRRAPWIFFSITFIVVLYNLLLSRILTPWVRKKPPYPVLLAVVMLTIVTMKTCLLFTSFSIYALPMGMLPLLLLTILPERYFAPSTTLLGVFLVTFFTGRSFGMLLFFAFGTLLALATCPAIRKRLDVGIPSLTLGATNAAELLMSSLDLNALAEWLSHLNRAGAGFQGEIFNAGMLGQTGWAFTGGLLAGPVALLFLPFLEVLWNTASTFKLHRYTDPQHPLLKELLTKAPGTYQHTMSVSYLAETAGEAVGANTLLLRAGAFYHDVGKTADPRYFVENQFDGKNPHDEIDPAESTRIILDHVRNGWKIALEAGIPEVIADFIPQHHGTLLVEYFFHEASKADPTVAPREEDFRYSGPKPQSVEAAILMICDAVEAASRTLHEPTREDLRKMILFVIENRLADGQFEECDLTTQDIGKITQTLTDSLAASFHTRVEYPWQQQETK